jgi:hypothetical protein
MQIEIWGRGATYAHSWTGSADGQTWEFTKETCLDKKTHKIQQTFWGLPERWRSPQPHCVGSLEPIWMGIALHVRAWCQSLLTSYSRQRATHTQWVPQLVWMRRSRAKFPRSPGNQSPIPRRFSTQPSHTNQVTGLISLSAFSTIYRNTFILHYVFSVC